MRSDHVLAFGAGVVVGWLVIPLIMGLISGKKMGS